MRVLAVAPNSRRNCHQKHREAMSCSSATETPTGTPQCALATYVAHAGTLEISLRQRPARKPAGALATAFALEHVREVQPT